MPLPALAAAAPYIAQAIPAAANLISRGGPRRQYKWNKRAAEDTDARNRKIQEEQRVYDSPKNQMSRFIEAGLNPHLIYGGGSGSSGGSFPFSAQPAQAPEASYGNVGTEYIEAGQVAAQTSLTEQKELESAAKTGLLGVQKAIADTNPMLNSEVYDRTIRLTQKVAQRKINEENYLKDIGNSKAMKDENGNTVWHAPYLQKIAVELERDMNKLGLETADLKIKNEILESKEFTNFVNDKMKSFYEDFNLTSMHILELGKNHSHENDGKMKTATITMKYTPTWSASYLWQTPVTPV